MPKVACYRHGEKATVKPSMSASGDELLNGEFFFTLKEARIITENWREHSNNKSPHNAFGYRPPAPEIIVPMLSKLVVR